MRRHPARVTWSLLALSATLGAMAIPPISALAAEPRVVVAGASPLPATVTIIHRTITTSLDVVLAQPHEAALTTFIASLSNTASANYHHYLTPRTFAQRFGAPTTSVAAVRSYLRGFGLHVGALSKGHVVLHVSGRTNDIARAFDASLTTVRRRDGVLAAQFTTRATMPASIARDVVAVAGLSTVIAPLGAAIRPRATGHVTLPGTCPSAGGSAGPTPNALGGYTVQQLAQLYGFTSAWAGGNTGVGQTIGIYELGAFSPGDLSTYLACYAIGPTLSKVNVDGGATGGFSDEATLDVEEAASLAPGAALLVYTGPNANTGPTDTYQQMADDNIATIITTSWGACESDPSGSPSSEQPIFQQMAAQGQTVISAAGDNGSSDCSGVTNNAVAVDDPASQPYVTGVGGLTVSSISPLNQKVWNDGRGSGGGAGGGGVSQLWSRPSWQNAPGISSSQTMRLVPDLSVVGDPSTGFIQYFTGTGTGICRRGCSGGWSSIGGTSIGAPLVSALVATAAQTCANGRLGFINPALYAMATRGFHDVAAGSNDLFGVGGYDATAGYDPASGLGSPIGSAFINGLCPLPADPTKSSFVPLNASPLSTSDASATLTLRDTSNHPIANAIVNVGAVASSGSVILDSDPASVTGVSTASYAVTTNAEGIAAVTVNATGASVVTLIATYQALTIATTTLSFANASARTARPGAPRIVTLVALVGGFRLGVRAPAVAGGSPVTAYQYSYNGGATWSTFSARTRAADTRKLAKGRTYRIIVRAVNVYGPGSSSGARTVTTHR